MASQSNKIKPTQLDDLSGDLQAQLDELSGDLHADAIDDHLVADPQFGLDGALSPLRSATPEFEFELEPEREDEVPEADAEEAEWHDKTTLMLRNLPNAYTTSLLYEELDAAGFEKLFDFVYVPIDLETNLNRGFAFINFVSPEDAIRFRSMYEHKKMKLIESHKFVCITPAELQGYDRNFSHYKYSRVYHGNPWCRPLFLRKKEVMATRNRAAITRSLCEPQDPGGHGMDILRRPSPNLIPRKLLPRSQYPYRQFSEEARSSSQNESLDFSGMQLVPPPRQFCQYCGGRVSEACRYCQSCGSYLLY
eukprot:TRINITY_DN24616_c0_g1_i2.p1 TRINITY_DN24616_c0_g1~~TRINITY_DN24616_c0_g1_i2.p1  ORF type:complete len:307 (+),score=34.70 TRINITY_DN24616_c0_g1_i2:103-1023(+)